MSAATAFSSLPLKTTEKVKKLAKKNRDAKAKGVPGMTEITAQVQQLLQKERHEGYLECCLQAENRDEPVLPWASRYLRLENGVLACFQAPEATEPLMTLRIVDVDALSSSPFQLAFTCNDLLHVIAFQADQETVEQWLKSIQAVKQLHHLSSTDAFERKTAAPTPLLAKSASFHRMSKALLYPAEQEPAASPSQALSDDAQHEADAAAAAASSSGGEGEGEGLSSSSFSTSSARLRFAPISQEAYTGRLEALVAAAEGDAAAAVWAAYLKELHAEMPFIEELRGVLGPEAHMDIFGNFAEVVDKSFALMDAYVRARDSPKKHSAAFKDRCKDLEALSSFCANREPAARVLKRKAKCFKDLAQISALEAILARPLAALSEFAGALKGSDEFDEASAILQDVEDNIRNVVCMFEDWARTTEDKQRKEFLSPAKRTLIFVDPTLDLPAMLFSDVLVLFDLVEDDRGAEVHQAHEVLPLALIELEDQGKVTRISAPALGRECKVKSPNNRAGNVFRKKVLEVKAKLGSKVALALSKVKKLPEELPRINCCVTHGDQLILGTDGGLFTLNCAEDKVFRRVCNTEGRRITRVEVSKNMEALLFAQQEPGAEHLELFTYPLVALNAFYAIQKHVHPGRVEGLDKVDFFCSFDAEHHLTRKLVATSGATVHKLLQDRNSDFVPKSAVDLEEKPSFLRFTNREVFLGTTQSILKFTLEPAGTHTIFKKKDSLVPLDCLLLDDKHLFCFENHAVLYSHKEKNVLSTPVWMGPAARFAVMDSHLLVFTENFVEVRHKDSLWEVQQLLPAAGLSVLNPEEQIVSFKNQIQKIVPVSSDASSE